LCRLQVPLTRSSSWLILIVRVRKRFAADGLAGVVRRDAMGLPGEEIAFPMEEFAFPGKGFGFPGGRFAFRGRELRFPSEELRFPGVEFAFHEQVLIIPGSRNGRFWAVFAGFWRNGVGY
jgi:hypothetical protein